MALPIKDFRYKNNNFSLSGCEKWYSNEIKINGHRIIHESENY